ncbi:translation initiation factor IF-2-like [Prionailurus viverrinus]|uniref:translation initiation factor IF-2-like n=1 Tax=Prionailurus viverrinus TaxID=61388 RepID=UPI001FF6D4CE|nr:translation initiation factor IF-2-like [Prionailurus viverrinus]
MVARGARTEGGGPAPLGPPSSAPPAGSLRASGAGPGWAALPPALRSAPRSPIDLLAAAAAAAAAAARSQRAPSPQAHFPPPPRPAPRCARVPVEGRRCRPRSPRRGPSSVLLSQNRNPRVQCGRRSLRFLQTPRRTLPPLPPPALGLQQPCRHPECVAWRPHREGFASGQNPDPGHPRRRGPAASRAAPERAAAPHQPPGPRSRSLRPEKRRGNFGRNFANFALGDGEAARPAAAAAGRDAQSGPQVRPGHPGACRAAQGGVRGRLAAPGSPLRPRASPTWPSAPVSERPATRSAQDGRDRKPGLQRK